MSKLDPKDFDIYGESYTNEVLRGSYHRLPVGIAILPSYMQWLGSVEFKIWHFLNCTIIRGKRKFDPLKLYTNFYLKGKLACSWSERALESVLKMDRRNLRRHIKNLSDKAYIVRERVYNPIADKNQFVYVIGEVKLTGISANESIYAYEKLWEKDKSKAESAIAANLQNYYENEMIFPDLQGLG